MIFVAGAERTIVSTELITILCRSDHLCEYRTDQCCMYENGTR